MMIIIVFRPREVILIELFDDTATKIAAAVLIQTDIDLFDAPAVSQSSAVSGINP